MKSLIERAKERLRGLQLKDIIRDLRTSADSHCIVTYPDSSKAYPVEVNEIFKPNLGIGELALYLHLPFCVSKCTFCQYTSYAGRGEAEINRYLSALQEEIKRVGELLATHNPKITSVYIGGGTPTYISQNHLQGLLKCIQNSFNLNAVTEFTVEASPDTILNEIGRQKLDVLKRHGVSRLSIGIQTFDDNILSMTHRNHNSKQAIDSIEEAKKYFDNVNIDLIAGFPNQPIESWERDLEGITKIGIPSVTVYPLTLKPSAKMYQDLIERPKTFPDQDSFLLRYCMAIEQFESLGYKEYPVWWFTRAPKYVNLQQIHKWENNGQLLALGVAGYSYINNWQYFNFRDLEEYYKAIDNDHLPIWKGAELKTPEEQGRRNLLLGIRCRINKPIFSERYGFRIEDKFSHALNQLSRLGLIVNTENEISPSYAGRLLIEEVVKTFAGI